MITAAEFGTAGFQQKVPLTSHFKMHWLIKIMIALRDYEGRVIKYTRELVDKLSSFSGKPVNVAKWFNFFAFDVMGDLVSSYPIFFLSFRHIFSGSLISSFHLWTPDTRLTASWTQNNLKDALTDNENFQAFGKPFNMLQSGKEHFAIQLLHKGQGPLAFLTPVPWMFRILTKIPGLSAGYYRFINWCEQQVDERRKVCLGERELPFLKLLILGFR